MLAKIWRFAYLGGINCIGDFFFFSFMMTELCSLILCDCFILHGSCCSRSRHVLTWKKLDHRYSFFLFFLGKNKKYLHLLIFDWAHYVLKVLLLYHPVLRSSSFLTVIFCLIHPHIIVYNTVPKSNTGNLYCVNACKLVLLV